MTNTDRSQLRERITRRVADLRSRMSRQKPAMPYPQPPEDPSPGGLDLDGDNLVAIHQWLRDASQSSHGNWIYPSSALHYEGYSYYLADLVATTSTGERLVVVKDATIATVYMGSDQNLTRVEVRWVATPHGLMLINEEHQIRVSGVNAENLQHIEWRGDHLDIDDSADSVLIVSWSSGAAVLRSRSATGETKED